jgi:amino acid adenylation domain-containing protein
MERELEIAASKLLKRAAQAGVFLSYSQERLNFKLTVEVFPQALKNEIVANKAALIALLKHREPGRNDALRPSRIVARARETNELPTSFAQQRLWFIDQLGGGSPEYNMPGGFRTRGRFSEDIAERVLRRIIQRHEPLRTVFRNGTEGPLQHIRKNFDFHLTRFDLSALPPEEQEQIVLETARADALKPFDLRTDVMLRASFLRLSEDEGVLLFNMHHITSDAWSQGILMKELITLYEAFAKGQPDPLPPLKVQYADYAQWQREWLAGEVLERQFHYWEEQLAEFPQVHALPLDRPRPAVQTFNNAVHRCTIDGATLASLKQIARQEQVTLFMVLHGLFALLLSGHSNSHDIVIGTPVANRQQPELEPLVGFFVNMLVLRTDCRPGCTFLEYLAHIKSVNLNAQANQDVPFGYLVERLKPQRSMSHAPLFQITFSLNRLDASVIKLRELELTPLVGPVAVKFDLMLEAMETSEDLRLSFIYNKDLFEESTIARLGEHLQNLAHAVVAKPEQQIETLLLLSESERQHLLYELNETAADYPRESCLHELFEAQVELRPEAVAVVFADRQLSYRELNEQANRLAHYLREQGVGPDTLVGLCVERSLAMVVGLLGILKAGGAYVPLDPSYPAERLEYMIADSATLLVLTQDLLEHRLPLGRVPRLRLDADKELLSAYPRHNPRRDEVGLTPEHLAYVIYTSGSTGRPKGVMGLHRSTVNRFTWMWKAFPFVDSDVCCQKTSLSLPGSIWEIFGPLLAGTPLVIISTANVKDPHRLVEALSFHNVTRIGLVPSLLQTLLESDIAMDEKLPKLNHWVCSEETLTSKLSKKFAEKLPGRVLLNLYGSSEIAADVTCQVVDASANTQRIPIGKPIANTQVYILDKRLQPVPRGVIGELYIAGDNLCRGYLLTSELTAERFLPCPYSQSAGARMYRTGDLGRWLPDGSIELETVSRQEERDVNGGMELLPIQRELLSDSSSYHDNTQAVLLTAPAGLDLWLHRIVESLYRQHDALRLRFTHTEDARHVDYAPLASSMVAESCAIETLPEDPDLHADFIGERCGYYQRSLETTHGPLFRAVYLQAPDQGESYLFLVTHHLIVVDISWRVLLRDLDEAYRQLHAKGLIQFAAEKSSYKQWGRALATYAESDALQDQRPTSETPKHVASHAGIRTVPLELTTDETAALLNDCTATYEAELNELLLAGVYLALRQWSGQSFVRITLEEHDSEDLFPEIDITEIVGCFITSYPLLLRNQDGAIAAVIKAVKEQYRAVLRYGMGYGLLGHVADNELLNVVAVVDPRALLFKQQSDFSQLLKTVSIFAVASEYKSDLVGPLALRGHALCLTVEVTAGALGLRLDYDENQGGAETIAALASSIEEAFRALIAHSRCR